MEFVIPLATRDAMGKTLVPRETYDILGAHNNMSDGFAPRHRRRCCGTLHLNAAPQPVYF